MAVFDLSAQKNKRFGLYKPNVSYSVLKLLPLVNSLHHYTDFKEKTLSIIAILCYLP